MHHHHTKLEGFGIAVQFCALFYNLESLQKTMGPNQMRQPLKYYGTSRISKIRTKTSGFSLLCFYRTNCARPWGSENSPTTSQSLSVLFQLPLGPYLHLFIFWSNCFFKPISKKQTLTSELPQFLHKPVVRGGLSNPEIPLKFSGQKKTSSTFPLSIKGMGWGWWVGETYLFLNLKKKKHTAEGLAIHPKGFMNNLDLITSSGVCCCRSERPSLKSVQTAVILKTTCAKLPQRPSSYWSAWPGWCRSTTDFGNDIPRVGM